MNAKTILLSLTALSLLALLSFKNFSDDGKSKTIMVSMISDQYFMITYGDGSVEKRKFNVELKGMNTRTWIDLQAQATSILNEMREKGYRMVGTADLVYTQPTILEKD